MENQKSSNALMILVLLIVSAVFGFGLGVHEGGKATRKEVECEAIKIGHAEWIPDEKGLPKFTWKPVNK